MAEDWEKIRGNGDRFNCEELAFIEEGFRHGRTPSQVARDLKASRRTVSGHFSRLRAEGMVRSPPPADYTARLYKPNFDL